MERETEFWKEDQGFGRSAGATIYAYVNNEPLIISPDFEEGGYEWRVGRFSDFGPSRYFKQGHADTVAKAKTEALTWAAACLKQEVDKLSNELKWVKLNLQ